MSRAYLLICVQKSCLLLREAVHIRVQRHDTFLASASQRQPRHIPCWPSSIFDLTRPSISYLTPHHHGASISSSSIWCAGCHCSLQSGRPVADRLRKPLTASHILQKLLWLNYNDIPKTFSFPHAHLYRLPTHAPAKRQCHSSKDARGDTRHSSEPTRPKAASTRSRHSRKQPSNHQDHTTTLSIESAEQQRPKARTKPQDRTRNNPHRPRRRPRRLRERCIRGPHANDAHPDP